MPGKTQTEIYDFGFTIYEEGTNRAGFAGGDFEFWMLARWKENGNYACGGGRDLLAWVG